MAGQGLFFRASTLFSNCRFLLNNRIPQIAQVAGVKQKSVDKLKELKVPEKPKRPLSPYFKFVQDHRNAILAKHPDWKITDVTRECAREWKTLDPETKEKYESEFKAQLEVYTKQREVYSKKLTDEQKEALKDYRAEVKKTKERRKLKKRQKENNKPKKPMGAYMLFVMDHMKGQDKKYSELLSELKGKWAELPEDKKAKYLEQVTRNKEVYQEELKKWEMKMIEEGNEDIVRNSTLTSVAKEKTE